MYLLGPPFSPPKGRQPVGVHRVSGAAVITLHRVQARGNLGRQGDPPQPTEEETEAPRIPLPKTTRQAGAER